METAAAATDVEPGPTRPNRGRRWAVTFLVVLTTLATFVSTIAVWGHAVLLDTDRWVATVGPLAEDEEVTDAVAQYLVEQVVSILDVEKLARDALPDQAGFLAAPLTDAVQGFVTQEVSELLKTEQFHTLWVEANRFAHSQAVRLLRGEPGVVMADDGRITLNLLPVIGVVLDKLDEHGLIPSSVDVPQIDRSTEPADAIASLSAALGVDIPEDFGQIEVYDNDALAQAQDAVRIFDRLVVALVVLTVVLAIAAIVLSTNRRRTILQLGLAIVAALVVSLALLNAASDHILGLITDDVDRSAAAAVVSRILASLRSIGRWIAWAGLIAAAIAFFTGESAWAKRSRSFVRQFRHREAPADPTTEPVAAISWMDRHRDALRILGVVVALAVLLLGSLSFGGLLILAGALALYEGFVALVPHGPPAGDAPGPTVTPADPTA
jgi:hypothetical protein